MLRACSKGLRLEEDTVVMLVADHGFLLGDHGWSGKISSRLYRELIHVPMILVDPERPGALPDVVPAARLVVVQHGGEASASPARRDPA